MTTVLLTGATGWIGSELGLALVRRGIKIRILCRDPVATRGTTAFPCDIFPWPKEGQAATESVAGVDIVVHLAGEPIADKAWSSRQRQKIRSSRVETGKQLVDAILSLDIAKRPKRFIQASAIGFYGDRGDEWLSEESEAGKGFLPEVCQEWEESQRRLAHAGIPATAVRIGVVIGRGHGFLRQLSEMANNFLGDIPGEGKQWLSWIHVDDLVRLFERIVMDSHSEDQAAGKVWNGIFNGVAPQPVRFTDFSKSMLRLMNVRPALKIPAPFIKLVLGKRAELVLGSARVSADKVRANGFDFIHSTMQEALESTLVKAPSNRANELVAKQWLPRPLGEIWAFFQDETNLEALTPKFLGFKVLGKSTSTMGEGTLIDYQIKLRGVPMKWRTRIVSWSPGREFVDEQLKGPYSIWYHTHTFEALAGGTLMTDHVVYQLPLMPLGGLLAGRFVAKDVQKIFGYRLRTAARLFHG